MIKFEEKYLMSENISFQITVYTIVYNDFRNDHFYHYMEEMFIFRIKYYRTLDFTGHGEYHRKLY